MVYTERAESQQFWRGTSHAAAKQRCMYTTSMDIQNALQNAAIVSNHMRQNRSGAARERRIALHKNDHLSVNMLPSFNVLI